jgi:hypothetical protein
MPSAKDFKRENIKFCTTPLRRGEYGHFWDKETGKNVQCRDLAKTPVGRRVLDRKREDGFWGDEPTSEEQCPEHPR